MFQKIIFLAFSLYDNFVIEEQAGYNRMGGCDYAKQWIQGILMITILYWALCILMLTIIYFSGEYLAIVVAVATLFVMIIMIVVYPLCIAPMFNDMDELDGE